MLLMPQSTSSRRKWSSFQASLKVSSQVLLPSHLAIRRPQKTGGNWRDQLDCILIMSHDQVQIVSVPSLNPMIGQTPSFVFRHCRSLHLYHNGRKSESNEARGRPRSWSVTQKRSSRQVPTEEAF